MKKERVVKLSDKFWSCECGKEHTFGAYVAAHWNESLIHTCDCGRKHELTAGRLILMENTHD